MDHRAIPCVHHGCAHRARSYHQGKRRVVPERRAREDRWFRAPPHREAGADDRHRTEDAGLGRWSVPRPLTRTSEARRSRLRHRQVPRPVFNQPAGHRHHHLAFMDRGA